MLPAGLIQPGALYFCINCLPNSETALLIIRYAAG